MGDPAGQAIVQKSAAYVAAVLASGIAVLTTIGITQDSYQLILRQRPFQVLVAYALIITGVGFELVAAFKTAAKRRRPYHVSGIIFLLVGLVVLLATAIHTLSQPGRPELSAYVQHGEQGDVVHIELKTERLKSDDRIRLGVFSARRRTGEEMTRLREEQKARVAEAASAGSQAGPNGAQGGLNEAVNPLAKETLYEAIIGPDNSGRSVRVLDIPLAAWEYERFTVAAEPSDRKQIGPDKYSEDRGLCESFEFTARLSACIEFAATSRWQRPLLNVVLPDGAPDKVEVTLEHGRMGPGQAVVLSVFDASNEPSEVYGTVLRAGDRGSLERKVTVPLPPGATVTCVAAVVRGDLTEASPNLAKTCKDRFADEATTFVIVNHRAAPEMTRDSVTATSLTGR
jgi:hypothetical protein